MCHQSVGLAARTLEEAGIVTVVIGSARDIVEEVGVPRYLFTDLPLGNPLGPPDETTTQLDVLRSALRLAERAWQSRITVQADVTWPGDPAWRDTYMALDDVDELRRMGERRRAEQAAARAARRQSPS